MSSSAECLHGLLNDSCFEEITLEQWESILLSLIAEEIDADTQPKDEAVPIWVVNIPKVRVAFALHTRTRESGEMLAALEVFRRRLPTKARLLLSEALTRMAQNSYLDFKRLGYKSGQAGTIVEKALRMSAHLRGVVRADVLEEMALDREFPYRVRAAVNLVGQPFSNSPPQSFWKKLEDQLSSAPELLFAVMEQYIDDYRPVDALKAMKHVSERPRNELAIFYIQMALVETERCSNRSDVLKSLFRELPPWVLELMKEKSGKFRSIKEVINLLEEEN